MKFVDLGAQYRAHKSEFDDAIAEVIADTAFIGGERVRNFERKFAEALGVRNCIACGNGTDAIYITLRMLGIGPGDEVITTAATWIATSEDVSKHSSNMALTCISATIASMRSRLISCVCLPRW